MRKAIISLLLLLTLYVVAWADLNDELIDAAYDGDIAEVERFLEAGAVE